MEMEAQREGDGRWQSWSQGKDGGRVHRITDTASVLYVPGL